MEEWKEYKLGDVCGLVPGFAFKSKDFGTGADIAIKIKDIQPPYVETIDADHVDISNYDLNKLSKFIVHRGEFLLAMTGATIGKIGKYIDEKPAYVNQRVLKFKDVGLIDYRYLFYFLSNEVFQSYILNHIDSQSAQPNISSNTIGKYTVRVPSLKTQQQIAAILSSLDDKIECNRRINDNLEQQAQALFKSWFVDFEPFKDGEFVESEMGMIPKGWRVEVLDNVIEIAKKSINPNRSPEILFTHYSIPAYDNEKQPEKQLGKEILSNKFIVRDDMTLFSKLNPRIKRIWYVSDILENSICSTEFVPFLAKDSALSVFVFSLVSSQGFYDYILSMVNGATGSHQRFHPEETLSYKIAYNQEIALEYNAIAGPMITQILKNQQESRRLAQLRDTLLPRLMSGELKVNEIERTVG